MRHMSTDCVTVRLSMFPDTVRMILRSAEAAAAVKKGTLMLSVRPAATLFSMLRVFPLSVMPDSPARVLSWSVIADGKPLGNVTVPWTFALAGLPHGRTSAPSWRVTVGSTTAGVVTQPVPPGHPNPVCVASMKVKPGVVYEQVDDPPTPESASVQ